MSVILQSMPVKCSRHLLRITRCYGLNLCERAPAVSSVNYCFMPRSVDHGQLPRREKYGEDLKFPHDFTLIYKFKHPGQVQFSGSAAITLTIATVLTFYKIKTEQNNSDTKDEEAPVPAAEVDSQSETEAETSRVIFVPRMKDLQMAKDKLYPNLLFLLPVIVMLILYMRSTIVLSSYRSDNVYITLLPDILGFGIKTIKHRREDVLHFPKKILFQYKISGKPVIISREGFINDEEAVRMGVQIS